MRLKKLVLQGYKTFASKTEFFFDEGITAVVGPNGSGKSNVSDAIRWVLGEQSYSTLRGKRTTDMIFTGSKSRPRAGMAQSIITLDNSDGWLPIDYTEVEICRRAYRTGENEYLLNGQKVRLKDVNELLAKAGLAEQTYTIIGQGLIDKALSLKADERRALFEEAAGISHYKSQRATTLRKLNDTQRNLERVYDILSELKPRLNSLKRQASRAENYTRLQEDLREQLKLWYGYQWEEAKTELSRRRKDAAAVEAGWQKARQQIGETQDRIDEARSKLHLTENRISKLQEEQESIRDKREAARREVAILQERRRAIERQLEESTHDLPVLEGQRETANQELNLAVQELETVQKSLTDQQAELTRFETGFREKQGAIDEAKRTVDRIEQSIQEARRRIARNQGQISQFTERIKSLAATQSRPTGDTADLEALQRAADSAKVKAAELNQTRETLRDQRRDLEGQIKSQRRAVDDARRGRDKHRTTVTRLQTRVEMLGQLRQPTTVEFEHAEVLGRMVDRIEMTGDPTWVTVLEKSLDPILSIMLTSNEAALKAILSESPTDRSIWVAAIDRATPPPTIDPSIAGFEAQASDLVTANRTDRPIIEALLGRVICSSDPFTTAGSLPDGCVALGKTGVLVYPSGRVERYEQADGEGRVAREAAFRDAEQALQDAESALERSESETANAQSTLKALNKSLDEVNRERQRIGRLNNEANQRAERATRDFDRAQQRLEFARQQVERQANEVKQLEERRSKAEAGISKDEIDLGRFESERIQAQESLDALPTGEAKQARQALTQQISATRSILDGRRAITDSRRSTLNQVDQQIERLKSRRQTLSHQLLQMNLPEVEDQLAELQTRMDVIQQDLDPLRTEQRDLQKRLRELETTAAKQQRDNQEVEARYTQTRVSLTQQETYIDNLQERIKTDLGLVDLSYDEEVRGDTPLPLGTAVVEQLPVKAKKDLPPDLEETITKQKAQLSRMGAINPDAPAEYEEVLERHTFMEQQIEDLEQTEQQLRSVIAELDDLTSRAFADTVKEVDNIFGTMFTRLFGGGSARLELTDPDDLTISGVDIVAQLPGRRAQGLALLSGGERSLTAASLIFALLKVSPTPFCVMDEVDAALDEANITRFRDVLKELSVNTQFVVITHNRGTVQAASAIYGITMGTDSASQVISVRPEEYITQAELLH